MNPDPENFEQLQKLLALKRHEQPPPGYFNSFSSKVIARIEAGESAGRTSWYAKLLSLVEARPMLTGAFGAAACALAISGFVFSEDGQDAQPHFAGHIATPLGASAQPVAMGVTADPSFFASNNVPSDLRELLNQPGLNSSFNSQSAAFGFSGAH
jgi:hypothetical protein